VNIASSESRKMLPRSLTRAFSWNHRPMRRRVSVITLGVFQAGEMITEGRRRPAQLSRSTETGQATSANRSL
jgi:hypothetical protein